ncbi:MAG: LLM class flavin-dependent oxidoreductase, partial [Acidimicrobiia bacterium]
MEFGYGLITCQRFPGDPRSAAEIYRDAIEIAKACEAEGLDSVWTSEHHFWDDDYMPSLLVLSAAIAAVTTRIKIGTGVLLAPLYHPIRLAEDATTVDLISGGRFILGLGIGWRAEEFERLGIPMERLGKRLSETVKILRASWENEVFEFKGKFFEIGPTNVTPKPTRPIPIWLGGFVEPAVRRAGRIADGYLGSAVALE